MAVAQPLCRNMMWQQRWCFRRSQSDQEELKAELRRCGQLLQERDQYLQQLGTKVPIRSQRLELSSSFYLKSQRTSADLHACIYLFAPLVQFQQVAEEKAGVTAQLRAVSQTLRDSQQRCHWLEGQLQHQSPATTQVYAVHPPGRHNDTHTQLISLCPSAGVSLHRGGSRSPPGKKHGFGKQGRQSTQGTVRTSPSSWKKP